MLVLAPSCSFEPGDLSSAEHMQRVLGGAELVFASPPCQAWLYAGDDDGDKTDHAVPSFRLFEALARAELPQLEVCSLGDSYSPHTHTHTLGRAPAFTPHSIAPFRGSAITPPSLSLSLT